MNAGLSLKKSLARSTAAFIILIFLLTAPTPLHALAYPPPPIRPDHISVVSPTWATTTNTNLTIAKPAGIVSGDVLIVNITQHGNSTTAPTSSGWTLIAGAALRTTGQHVYGALLFKVAGGFEPDDYTFTLGTGTNDAVGAIASFSDVDIAVFDLTPGTIHTANLATVTAPSITTISNNAALIMFGMADGTGGAPAWSGWSTTSPGALTELYDYQSTSASVGAAWAVLPAPGATGAGTATLTGIFRHGGILIALKPTKVTPVVWLSGNDVTYNGAAQTPTFNSSPTGAFANKTYNGSSTVPTEAGSYEVRADFTPTDMINYASLTNTFVGTLTIHKADAAIAVTPYTATYNGAAYTATGTATGIGSVDLSSLLDLSGTTHTNAGTYTDDAWSFAGNANYNSASGMVEDTIAKANAAFDLEFYSVTYDGSEHQSTGTATGVETPIPVDLSSLLDLSSTAHTNAGDYHDAWSFVGNTNYNSVTGWLDNDIAKADATIDVTTYAVSYDGKVHTATGTATGVGLADLSAYLDLSGTSHTRAGDYTTDAWVFSGNPNYNTASGTVHDSIAKVNAVIQVTAYSVVYDGSIHTAVGTASGVEATPADLSRLLDLSATSHTNVGDYPTDAWAFAGDDNYNPASGTVHDSISIADQTITFGPLANLKISHPDFEIGATASSGLTVSFSSDTTTVCALIESAGGWWVHLAGLGTCTIKADQSGNSNYTPAAQVIRSFEVSLHTMYVPIFHR